MDNLFKWLVPEEYFKCNKTISVVLFLYIIFTSYESLHTCK